MGLSWQLRYWWDPPVLSASHEMLPYTSAKEDNWSTNPFPTPCAVLLHALAKDITLRTIRQGDDPRSICGTTLHTTRRIHIESHRDALLELFSIRQLFKQNPRATWRYNQWIELLYLASGAIMLTNEMETTHAIASPVRAIRHFVCMALLFN